MCTIEIEEKISAAFHHGELLTREMRLTPEEAEYLRTHCAAQLSDLGEHWYKLQFKRGSFA